MPHQMIGEMTPGGAKERREMPEDNLVAREAPPAFGWRSGQDRYTCEVRVERDGERVMQFVTPAGTFRPDRPLDPGRCALQVRRRDSF